MRKTPQHARRENIKKLFDRVLHEKKTVLSPLSITAHESLNDHFTTTDFSFEDCIDAGIVTITESRGRGFVDGLFKGLHGHYCEKYSSIRNIKLVDMIVNPLMKNTKKSLGSEAKTDVIFRVEIVGHGMAEFQNTSRSMIYSGFAAALQVFEFYVNCEKTFDKISLAVVNAKERNRGDILQNCMTDLSRLTEVNTYVRKTT